MRPTSSNESDGFTNQVEVQTEKLGRVSAGDAKDPRRDTTCPFGGLSSSGAGQNLMHQRDSYDLALM